VRIRTRAGQVLDLADLRMRTALDIVAYDNDGSPVAWSKAEARAVLDALEAACSVRDAATIVVDNQWDDGYVTAMKDVRQAAGVIEE
jgi:hypothetical protein